MTRAAGELAEQEYRAFEAVIPLLSSFLKVETGRTGGAIDRQCHKGYALCEANSIVLADAPGATRRVS